MTETFRSYAQDIMPDQIEDHMPWVERARVAARVFAKAHGTVTIDDVRETCPPPAGTDPRIMGSVFKPSTQWVLDGYRRSTRKECHKRPLAVWRLP